MHVLDEIVSQFDVDYREYGCLPKSLVEAYPVLLNRGNHFSNEFGYMSAAVILQYCVLEFVRSRRGHDNAIITMMNNIKVMTSSKYPDGRALQEDINAYFHDYMMYVRQQGGVLSVPDHLRVDDLGSFFASMNKVAYPYIEALTNFALGSDFSGNSFEFMNHFIARAKARYHVYSPLLERCYLLYV